MSFRIGNKGDSLWEDCLKKGIAIITYGPLHDVDLSEHESYQPTRRWSQLASIQRFSLGSLAYRMRPKDVIYAKEGPSIVGKGLIRSTYRFDPDVLGRNDVDWAHHVKVNWVSTYPEGLVRFIGPAQSTVHQLPGEQVSILERRITKAMLADNREAEALEGRFFRCTRGSRERNRRLAQIKKTGSDYTCEVCEFQFEKTYGEIGHSYIVVHHLEPIGSRRRATMTTIDDLVLVCPNCHVMLHKESPPLTPETLRKMRVRAAAKK